MKKMEGYKAGGSLKPVPSDNKNKGLSKLPTAVRNKMGYMGMGGSALESSMNGIIYKHGGSCGKVYKKGSFRK